MTTVFFRICWETQIVILMKTRFRDLQEYIELEKHPSERFRFVAYDEKVMNVKKYYEESRRDHERIGLIFFNRDRTPG